MAAISGSNRNLLVVVLAVVAIALAVWSGVRTFGPKGRTIGHLGNLQESTGVKPAAAGAQANPAKSLSDQEATGGLAGAPAGAQPGP